MLCYAILHYTTLYRYYTILHYKEQATKAIEDGVNVLIWSFISIKVVDGDNDNDKTHGTLNSCRTTATATATATAATNDNSSENEPKQQHQEQNQTQKQQCRLKVEVSQNLENYKKYRQRLISMGYDDNGENAKIKHLVAFGGWNGPHFPSEFSGSELYDAFKAVNVQSTTTPSSSGGDGHGNGDNEDSKNENVNAGKLELLWDGIDWDLEGHDQIDHPNNEFTKELLDQIGEFSIRAKNDGLIVSMAPPESYLDTTSSRFSRFVNLSYPEDAWHQDFLYHSWNVYAYILAKYGDSIDFIFLQFYESYSHALYQTEMMGLSQSEFLIQYIERLAKNGFVYTVNFEDDPTVNLKNQPVKVPLSKIVFGFANGWAADLKKAILFAPSQVKSAYDHLVTMNLAPRGFGYWVVEEEGKNGIFLTKELKAILNGSETATVGGDNDIISSK